jgi:light-regulated signal transduction histidine kinase (bacteriophytochrome)
MGDTSSELLDPTAVHVAADPSVASFEEMTRLNNDLVRAQRELALQNARQQRLLDELSAAREETSRQHDEIQRINAELRRSNEELQQFAYVVSHDLQAPLRSMTSFAQLLDERYSGALDEKARRWLGHIVAGAARMRSLTNDLLELARVGGSDQIYSQVDTLALVARVSGTLEHELRVTGGDIDLGQLPVIWANATQIEQLFQNLLHNALTHRSERPPHIAIHAVREDGGWRFAVSDNGPGIAEADRRAIFEPMRRATAHAAVPGTGLGLAIARKIVERHGGRIWVESSVGDGSTFYFTISDQVAACAKVSGV